MTVPPWLSGAAAIALTTASAAAQSSTVVGFDGGAADGFGGNLLFEASGGNPGGNAHMLLSSFFPSLRTGTPGGPSNAAFLGDYSQAGSVTFRLDVKVDSLVSPFTGQPLVRPLGIALVDHDPQGATNPAGLFFELALLSSANQPNWTELSVTIDDTSQPSLPAGWTGFGAEDPNTFEPILPAGVTFASVLASVDEVRITGAVPGFFFNNALFDMRIDNVAVELGGGLGTPYCSANQNSTGGIGTTVATGSAAAANNDVTLGARGLPPGQFGIFAVSRDAGQTPLNAGILCLGGTLGRYSAPGQIFQADAGGAADLSIDLMAIPQGGVTVPALAGETWRFQAWHRDIVGGQATSNLALPTAVTLR